MLVLKRKIGQRIKIDGPCTIQVVRVGPRGESVRLGITADTGVKILREELIDVDGVSGGDGSLLDPLPTPDFCGQRVGEAAGEVGPLV